MNFREWDELPKPLTGETIDQLLAAGYYRMIGTMFTTNYTEIGYCTSEVFWLRVNLQRLPDLKNHKFNRRNRDLTATLVPSSINDEASALYEKYAEDRMHILPPTLESYYNYDEYETPFQEWCMEVRLGKKLIACGYLNPGKQAAMGILSIYDPEHKNRSLGKYLMLQKMMLCQRLGMDYFYPGYLALDSPKFDYKIFPSLPAMEVYLPEPHATWIPFPKEGKEALRRFAYFNNRPFGDEMEHYLV